jgi:hypothetical protein
MNDIAEVGQKLSGAQKVQVFNEAKDATPEETVEILVDAGIIEPKAWWQSLGTSSSAGGMAGSVALIVVSVAKAFGWEFDIGATELLIGASISLVTYALTWWGRVKAAQPISMTQVLPGVTLKGQP